MAPDREEQRLRTLRPARRVIAQQQRSVIIPTMHSKRDEITIYLAPYDPAWPAQYAKEEAKVRAALGNHALVLEHVGSTSIPGIKAKPIIDILLAVPDSSDEDSYVPSLTAQGYRFHLRELDWEQHRLLKGADPAVNLHVFTIGSREIARMICFRDRCRSHPEERQLYEETKRALTARAWPCVQDYADAKRDVVEAIIARALGEPSTK